MYISEYRIMQIVCGGKVSRLHDLLVIRGKTFTIVQQFETLYNKKKKFAGKPSRLEANPRKPRKFSITNDLHYTVLVYISEHECTTVNMSEHECTSVNMGVRQ